MVNPYEAPTSDVARGSAEGGSRPKGALKDHEMAGRSLKAVGWLQLIGVVGIYAAVFIPVYHSGQSLAPRDLLFLLAVLLPLFSMLVGSAVAKQRPWGRNVALGYCTLMLIGFPVGTLMGAYILFYLIRNRQAA